MATAGTGPGDGDAPRVGVGPVSGAGFVACAGSLEGSGPPGADAVGSDFGIGRAMIFTERAGS